MAHIDVSKGEHGGKELMIVTVDEPSHADPYFVGEDENNSAFYYRRENSTLRLRGGEVARYMEQVANRRKRQNARSR